MNRQSSSPLLPGRALRLALAVVLLGIVLACAPPVLQAATRPPAGTGLTYLDTYGDLGHVDKVRLSDFAPAGTLTLETGETYLTSGAIDPASGFAYFAARALDGYWLEEDSIPFKIIKVQLADLRKVATLVPAQRVQDDMDLMGIDPARGFAYLTAKPSHPYVSSGSLELRQVRLSDFTTVRTLSLGSSPPYTMGPWLLDILHGYAYAVVNDWSSPMHQYKLVEIRLSDLTQVRSTNLHSGDPEVGWRGALIDPEAGFAYLFYTGACGNWCDELSVEKIRLSDLQSVGGTLVRQSFSSADVIGVAIDPVRDYAYYGYDNLAPLGRIDLGNMKLAGTLSLDHSFDVGVLDADGGYGYFGGASQPDGSYGVTKVRLSDFTKMGHVDLNDTPNLSTSVIDPQKGYAYFGSSSDPGVVLRIDLGNTRTTLASSANPAPAGSALTFTATVSPVVANSGTPGGSVQFQVDGEDLGSPIALSAGQATSPSVSSLSRGTHTVSAQYTSPNADWNDSGGTLTQTMGKPIASLSLSSNPNPSWEGQEVTVAFSVTSSSGTPTGNVTVSDGTSQCAATVASGTCKLTLFNPEAKTLTATYAGDTDFLGSSATLPHTVTNLVPKLLTLDPPTSAAGSPGLTLTVTGENLIPGTGLQWNGTLRATTVVSSTRLTAPILAADLVHARTIPITVQHPGVNGDTSNALTHTIQGPSVSLDLFLPWIAR